MPTNIYIHMTPATRMELSNALTDAGTGSEAQFAQFTVGSVPTIAGVEVIDNPYMPEGIIRFMPTNVIGTPDMDVMMTRISVGYDENQLVDTNTGQHYFDSVVITPELIVELTFTAPVKADIKEAKSEAKEAKADMEKLVKELVKAEAEAAKQAEKEAKKAAKAEAEAQKTAELEAKQAEAKAKAQAARVEAQRKAAEAANLTK